MRFSALPARLPARLAGAVGGAALLLAGAAATAQADRDHHGGQLHWRWEQVVPTAGSERPYTDDNVEQTITKPKVGVCYALAVAPDPAGVVVNEIIDNRTDLTAHYHNSAGCGGTEERIEPDQSVRLGGSLSRSSIDFTD